MTADWTLEDAIELYGVRRWGNGFFDLNEGGEVTIKLRDGNKSVPVSLAHIVGEIKERGHDLPLTLRFHDLLDQRIEALHASFATAFKKLNYQGEYRGVYPIKVNQQQQVIEEVTEFGRPYHYGLEAGSKAELIIALAHLTDPEAYLICNGYKDDEFIDLALRASQTGQRIILVIEMPTELPAILARAKALEVRPCLGIRFRLSTLSEGHWAESGGDRSVFGLNTAQLIDVIDSLRKEGYLDCLTLLHYHQGSQLPNIRAIREAANEAARVYINLVQEGAPMGILDLGGGLAVDYDGSHANLPSSCNYTLEEYAADLVEVVQETCDQARVKHPTLITESGRAVVAYYSVLVFNILDVTRFANTECPEPPHKNAHPLLKNLWEVSESLRVNRILESFNDALFYRDKVRALFNHGVVNLRERAWAEKIYWYLVTSIMRMTENMEHVPEELQELGENLTDFYYGNFSVFQSLPDQWAIEQLFPIMPLEHHLKKPTHQAILADITCDCDGKINRFIDPSGFRKNLPVHNRKPGEDYLIGCFLVGAYQETLGDLHNLLGDPNVVSVGIESGELIFTNEIDGDTVANVLSYVEYEPRELESRFRRHAEQAVKANKISPHERKILMKAFRETLNGYTYYES